MTEAERVVFVYHPNTENRFLPAEQQKRAADAVGEVAAFAQELKSVTGYRVVLVPMPHRVLRRVGFMATLVSDAFVFGRGSIFFDTAHVPKEELLHEIAHVEAGRRYGRLVPQHRTMEVHSCDMVVRLRDNIVAHLVSEVVADIIVYRWGKNLFTKMFQKRYEQVRRHTLTSPDQLMYLLAYAELLKRAGRRKLARLFYREFAKSARRGFFVSDALRSTACRLIKQGVGVAANITEAGSRRTTRRLLAEYTDAVEKGFSGTLAAGAGL